MNIRLTYSYDKRKASDESATRIQGETMTQQHPAQETNINRIMAKFLKTGLAPGAKQLPTFQDFDNIFDFQSAQNALIQAKDSFMSLPAQIRTVFNNDPQQLITAMASPDRKDEMIKLGLIKKPEPRTVQPFERMDEILAKHFPPKETNK